jgi:hypothetical protein
MILIPKLQLNDNEIIGLRIESSKLKCLEPIFKIYSNQINGIEDSYSLVSNWLNKYETLNEGSKSIFSINYDSLQSNEKFEIEQIINLNNNINFSNKKCIYISEEDFFFEIALDRNYTSLANRFAKYQCFDNQILIIKEDIISLTIKKNLSLIHGYSDDFLPIIIKSEVIISILRYWKNYLHYLMSIDLSILDTFNFKYLEIQDEF